MSEVLMQETLITKNNKNTRFMGTNAHLSAFSHRDKDLYMYIIGTLRE